ncbi:hypothetical protein JKF63_07108 [Porcisia hertigi]|uniref:Uncharacterized protein n=1 Tax=Porcisia hertigi TaxID=2761500 RepID=A0A836LKC8_9TRYP|nr:hypothetical protein JKF63_07108 [Porcisia hertigi]
MSQLQNRVRASIDDVEDLLASISSFPSNEVSDRLSVAYQRFVQHVWHELPLNGAGGPALATVSCMPLWELLNQHTGACTLSAAPVRAIAVQLLSSMYPKSKDRRCVFQQPSCYGTNSQTAVPLSTQVPIRMLVPNNSATEQNLDYVKAAQRVLRIAAAGHFTDGKESSAVASAVCTFINTVLPKCTLVSHPGEIPKQTAGEVYIVWNSSACDWSSGTTFLLILWCLFLAAEYLGLPESKKLSVFLCTSRWSMRVIELDERKVSYSELLSPFLDICSLCLSGNPRSAPASVDTVPLIDPRVIPYLMGSDVKVHHSETDSYFAKEYDVKPAIEVKKSLTLRRADYVKEQLIESIPNEIDFMGASSSCRDFDQLAYLCRDCLFVPTTKSVASGVSIPRRRDMLFNRKRTRGAATSDGPCFIPVKSAVSDMLEKSDTNALVTLERLCCKWKEGKV